MVPSLAERERVKIRVCPWCYGRFGMCDVYRYRSAPNSSFLLLLCREGHMRSQCLIPCDSSHRKYSVVDCLMRLSTNLDGRSYMSAKSEEQE